MSIFNSYVKLPEGKGYIQAFTTRRNVGRTEVARPGDGARRQVVSHWVFQISRIFVFSPCIQCELWAAAATEKKMETRGIGFLYFFPLNQYNINIMTGWWFGTFFIFHNIWDNTSHWRTHIFQDGYCTTNQTSFQIKCCRYCYWQ